MIATYCFIMGGHPAQDSTDQDLPMKPSITPPFTIPTYSGGIAAPEAAHVVRLPI